MLIRDKDKMFEPKEVFLGSCLGIALEERDVDDPHVMILIIVEDDGSWFVDSGGFSSYWLYDLREQIIKAEEWMDKNCIKGAWGYEFK